jgi:CubicO group peptidase (beta-lactamase class C family)
MSASLLLLARLVCGIAESSVARTPEAPLDPSAISRRTEQWIRPYVAAGDFSGVVLIAQSDRIIVEKAYGKADFEHDVPN